MARLRNVAKTLRRGDVFYLHDSSVELELDAAISKKIKDIWQPAERRDILLAPGTPAGAI
ncbi:hypothetical protein PAAG_00353 [Paracoccidioides lutzii Pb01]|uniref:Uncharacterized protein n=1 Tax=Paracoccidioides lutzii (strain ATCC MYA-826 / Pb01) TaxID=502779 RepID=C1GPA8_PARBA|nr:hypothetical protein PAAG_00353 [Paracoccidioides lutzii Pb01]EEH36030.1 hypothetical protein PAAG_00353 [Paracoccidioides lutzii Pb01]